MFKAHWSWFAAINMKRRNNNPLSMELLQRLSNYFINFLVTFIPILTPSISHHSLTFHIISHAAFHLSTTFNLCNAQIMDEQPQPTVETGPGQKVRRLQVGPSDRTLCSTIRTPVPVITEAMLSRPETVGNTNVHQSRAIETLVPNINRSYHGPTPGIPH